MSSRKIGDLERNFRGKVEEVLRRCNLLELDVVIVCTQDEFGAEPMRSIPSLAMNLALIRVNSEEKTVEVDENFNGDNWINIIAVAVSLNLLVVKSGMTALIVDSNWKDKMKINPKLLL